MSRFAKLVNAKAAREQEPPRQIAETKPTSLPYKEESESSDATITPVITPVITGVITPVRTPVTTPASTPVITGATTPVADDADSQREPPRTSPQYLDATHTASEQRVYSVMYRETVSRGIRERHFGPKELCEKSGIRSDRTIRTALDGLIEKLSVEIVSNSMGSPLGPRYRVFDPKEIVGRRKTVEMEIDTQSKKITTPATTGVATGVPTPDKNYRGTPAKSTGVTGVDFAGVYNKYINNSLNEKNDDDEAYAPLLAGLRRAVREVTGGESPAADSERWGELAELLVTELKIAAGRTGSVSSVPAFLTEHLRRRLWKTDKRQVEGEAVEKREGQSPKADASECPDCFGTGMFYPEGFEKGVARCAHEKLAPVDSATATAAPDASPQGSREGGEIE